MSCVIVAEWMGVDLICFERIVLWIVFGMFIGIVYMCFIWISCDSSRI